MPAVRIVTEEDRTHVCYETWTLFGNYGTARKDRHMADPVLGA